MQPVDPSFFRQTTLDLAKSLLGMLLVKETEAGTASGWIVETEAYVGPGDRAAHSYGNRRTKRTEVMFGPPGFAYTYRMHTHCLLNVVSGPIGHPEVVLIRSVEPYTGIELMRERRGFDRKLQELANGPGKLTKCLGISIEDYGRPLFESPLFIAEGRKVSAISVGPRIGIENSGEAKHYEWRFWEKDSPFVPKKGFGYK
ncbi:DNA-3-methyladenine glycosylase [Paenibacillus sp. GYB003]|uniref:DNA-3-methyladenine glycosylase n=1 Tax=Paenibacillus sp. GYB003 TaxID=2994392 RepID=UPI002F96ACBB